MATSSTYEHQSQSQLVVCVFLLSCYGVVHRTGIDQHRLFAGSCRLTLRLVIALLRIHLQLTVEQVIGS